MAANVKFLQGTLENFKAITPDNNTFYLVGGTDLYLGSKKLTNGPDVDAAVSRIATNEGDISKLKTDLAALIGSSEGSISSQLAALKTELEGYTDTKVATEVGNEVSRAQQAEGVLSKAIEDLGKIVAENETDIEDKVSTLSGTVAGHTTTIGEHDTAISGLDSKIDTQIGNVNSRIGNVDTRIDNLLGDDLPEEGAAPTIREIAEAAASAKVDAVVDGAPESFDTLKEIANWITNDETGAASIAATVAENVKDIKTLEGLAGGLRTDVNKNAEDIKALQGVDAGFETRIAANEAAVATVNERIAKAKKEATDHADSLNSAMETRVGDAEGKIATVEETVESHGTRITAVEGVASGNANTLVDYGTRIGTAEGKITALENLTAGYKDIVNNTWSEVTDAANAAQSAAIAYTDGCLTWNPITNA